MSENASADSNFIRRGNIEPPRTLDPALADDVHTFNILIDLYEGLLAEDAAGQQIAGVAEQWSVSEDGLRYTFTLRANARWSNGEPVLAAHFVNGFRRAASADLPASYAVLLTPIKNFSAVKAGADNLALGVSASDARTLVIELEKPSAHFLSVLSMPIAYPLFAENPEPEQFHDPAVFIGNGPFVLDDFERAGVVSLRRNKHYWDSNSVHIEGVHYVGVADELSEHNMYRSGELDITATVPTSHIQLAREERASELRIAPSLALYYLAFDLTEPPLDNLALRRALSMAIDRDALVSLLGRGEQAAYGVVPPGVSDYRSTQYDWHSLTAEERQQQARVSLKAAGYDEANGLTLKLTYDAGGVHERVAVAVSRMWIETLGIDVTLEKKEWKYFLETRDERSTWQVMRFSWFGDYNDASTFTDIFHSSSEQNLPRYHSEAYDALLSEANAELKMQVRQRTLGLAENMLLDDYPIAPLYFYVSKHMVKPQIRGFENNVLDRHPSKYLSLSKRADNER